MQTQTQSKATSSWDDQTGEVFDDAADAQLANVPHVTMAPMQAPADGSMFGAIVQAAQAMPARDQKRLILRAQQIGSLLGKKGFYRFPMGGKPVEGESIHLAQALAQEWGGIIYQTRIVHSEPLAGGGLRVHLRSSVADMRALVCAEIDQVVSTLPPPAKFAENHEQRERWNALQVQSASSKVVRNALLDVLPKWFTSAGFEAAKGADAVRVLGTNDDGSPKTLEQARAEAVAAFAKGKIEKAELEAYVGEPVELWAVPQISALLDLWSSLKSGATSVEAFRASIADKPSNGDSKPKRNALGIAGNGGDGAGDDKTKAERERAAKAGDAKAAEAKKGDAEKKDDQSGLPGVK